MTVSPVTFNGQPVVLSSDPAVPSNYPSGAAINAFVADSRGTLNLNNASVEYSARATLTSMRVLTDYFTSLPVTLQTWEVIGVSRVRGAGAAMVEVSSVIERQAVPVFSYAAFATHHGCDALSFVGGAETKSYDSGLPLVGGSPVIDLYDGNVGTNGNLAGDGDTTTINGTLSTPRAGVGDCTTNNVTASTIEGWATVEEGLVTLPQAITLPTPPPFPPPGGGNVTFNSSGGCPAAALYCTGSGGVRTITPPSASSVVSMGDVALNGGAVVHLHAGVYQLNSLTLAGSARIVIDSGPVIIKIAGQGRHEHSSRSVWWRRLESVYGSNQVAVHLRREQQHQGHWRHRHRGAGLRAERQCPAGRRQHTFLRRHRHQQGDVNRRVQPVPTIAGSGIPHSRLAIRR